MGNQGALTFAPVSFDGKNDSLTLLSKKLMKMSKWSERKIWSELEGDATSDALRFDAMGWLPDKPERLTRFSPGHGFCVLVRGSGVFFQRGATGPVRVEAPGLIFAAAGDYCDYGAAGGSHWDEIYWALAGSRLVEWKRFGWWPPGPCFRPITADVLAEIWELFVAGVDALERRDGHALDLHKLDLERWLCEQSQRPRVASALEEVVDSWRREPQRAWSLTEAAAATGKSYTRFRVEFLKIYRTSPYDYLLRLRLELAANILRGTPEPVKSVAWRCGFKHLETFLRAFERVYGTSPRRWRNQALTGMDRTLPADTGRGEDLNAARRRRVSEKS